MITLPDGRQIRVAGKSLAQIESAVVHTYYPDFVRTRPAVYAQVLEYRMLRVQVMGAVARPGIYRLRHDQMSLVGLLMEAGGITDDGAALIRITRSARADVASHEKTTVSQVALRKSRGRDSHGVSARVTEAGSDRKPAFGDVCQLRARRATGDDRLAFDRC